MPIKRIAKRKPRKKPEEYVQHVKITEEGQERLFSMIREYYPTADDIQCLELLWGNTDAPYGEYRVVKNQLEEFLERMNANVENEK